MNDTTCLVLVNEQSGTHDLDTIDALEAALHAQGGEVERRTTVDPADVADAIRGHDGRTVIVTGGDGSIHLAVQTALDLDLLDEVRFGLLPLGTGNDLAGYLDLPTDPGRAAAALHQGRSTPHDLLVADDGGVVVNVVHAGLGAEASAHAAPIKDAAGAFAYPLGALIAGVTESGWDLSVTLDDVRLTEDEPILMVAAGVGGTVGGGTPILPNEPGEPSMMRVMVSTDTGNVDRAAFAVALQDGSHVDRASVTIASGTDLVIEGAPIRHCADGEIGDETEHRRYRHRPGAWHLVTP